MKIFFGKVFDSSIYAEYEDAGDAYKYKKAFTILKRTLLQMCAFCVHLCTYIAKMLI